MLIERGDAHSMDNPWKKMTPEEHFSRITSGADREAWDHLNKLVYLLVAKNIRQLGLRNISAEDQTGETLAHLIEKLRAGKLRMKEPVKFYGLLRVIVLNCLKDKLRDSCGARRKKENNQNQDSPQLQLRSFEYFGLSLESVGLFLDTGEHVEKTVEHRIILRELLYLLLTEDEFSEDERSAFSLYWSMHSGSAKFSDHSGLTEELSKQLNRKVSYEYAACLIHTAKKKLQALHHCL